MYSKKIKALHDEYTELIDFCRSNEQVSFEMYINDTYKKSLLLSAASYFESTILKIVHDFAESKSRQNSALVSFVENKAIKRQYHTFFNWESNNANVFWGLFGDTFKQEAKKQIQEKGLADAERAFISIGRERNLLVHQNYIEATINDTFEEIYEKYEKACDFVELISQLLSP